MNKHLRNFEQMLINQDMYGYAISVTYKGKGSYKTRLGTLLTLTTYVLMIINSVNLMTAFSDGSKQDEKSTNTTFDRFKEDDKFKFDDYNMSFNIQQWPPLPANIARIRAF